MKRTPNHLWRRALTLLLAFAMVAPFIVPPLKIVAQDVTIDCGWNGGTITDDGTGNNVLTVSAGSATSGKFTVYQGFSYTATADIIGDGSIDIVFYAKDGALLPDTKGASSTGSTDEIAPFGATQAVISLNATGTAAFDNITLKDNTVIASGSNYIIPLVNGNFNDSSATKNTPIYDSNTAVPGWEISGGVRDSGELTGSFFRIQQQIEDPAELQLFAQVGTAPISAADTRTPAPILNTASKIPIAPGLTYTLGGLTKKMSGDATDFVYRLYVYDQNSARIANVWTFIDYPTSTDFSWFSGSINLDNEVFRDHPAATSVDVRLIMSRQTVTALFDDLVLQVSGYSAPVLINGTLDNDFAAIDGSIPNNNLSYHYSEGTLTLSATDDTKPALIPGSDPWAYEYVPRDDITKIVIGKKIDTISDNAFVDCTRLNEIVLTNDMNTIGQKAFACTVANNTELTIAVPKQVQTLPTNAFENRTNVQMTVWYASPTISFVAPGVTTTVKGSMKILFIGNSLSDDASDMLHTSTSYLYSMLRSQLDSSVEVAVGLAYSGGKYMAWHADQAINNGQSYEFYYIADGMTSKRKNINYSSKDALLYDDWDIVVLQPYHTDAHDFNLLRPSLVTMLDHVQKYQPYSKCLLEMVWPRDLQNTAPELTKLSATHQAALSCTSTDGKYNVDGIVPVGTAVSSVVTSYIKNLSYNMDITSLGTVTDPQNAILRDQVHLSYNVGRYMAGYMFARYIIGDEWSTAKEIPLRNSLAVGALPEEYRTIVTTAANAALANPYVPLDMSSTYGVDPAHLAQTFLSQNKIPVFSGLETTADELKELIKNTVASALAGVHADYQVNLLNLSSCTAPSATAAGSYTANFEVRFGYTTVTVPVSGSIAICTHAPVDTWTTDGEYHWKVCSLCGNMITSTKAKHASTGANVAAFQKQATCDACKISYGGIVLFEDNFNYTSMADALAHNWTGANVEGVTFVDGCMVVDAYKGKDNHIFIQQTLDGLGIPSSFSTMDVTIQFDFVVSAEKRSYNFLLNGFKDANDQEITHTRYTASNGTFKIAKTATDAFETVTFTITPGQEKLSSFLDEVTLRVGVRGGTTDDSVTSAGTDFVKFDSVRVTLLPATGSYHPDHLSTFISGKNAYAVLPSDVTIDGSLTLGENAVLDLNGHKLTATMVSPGTNATIIDSSANKTGKLIVPRHSLVLKSNNPQLPLWTGTGYIFTEPQLGPERAFLVASSADGFTMDFRPGFGEWIRLNYLSQGTTDIKMTADLSWTDIYGHAGFYEGGLSGTKIFNEMYETETARGRLQITGAEKYRNISLTLTLESCGVKVSFDPIVFNNTYVTTHFAADFENGSMNGTTPVVFNVGKLHTFRNSAVVADGDNKVLSADGTNVFTLDKSITVGAGKTMVIEFDLYADAYDYFGIRHSQGNSQYDNILATNGYPGSKICGDFFSTTSQAENKNLSKCEDVHIRMTIDLDSGRWYLYRNGVEYSRGTNAVLAADLEGTEYLYLAVGGQTNQFDNLLIYTVTN